MSHGIFFKAKKQRKVTSKSYFFFLTDEIDLSFVINLYRSTFLFFYLLQK